MGFGGFGGGVGWSWGSGGFGLDLGSISWSWGLISFDGSLDGRLEGGLGSLIGWSSLSGSLGGISWGSLCSCLGSIGWGIGSFDLNLGCICWLSFDSSFSSVGRSWCASFLLLGLGAICWLWCLLLFVRSILSISWLNSILFENLWFWLWISKLRGLNSETWSVRFLLLKLLDWNLDRLSWLSLLGLSNNLLLWSLFFSFKFADLD